MSILLTDAILTAYALDELDAEERAAVEAALKDDEAARRTLDEIRGTIELAETAYADPPAAELNERQREAISNAAERPRRRRLRYLPHLVAAAALFLFVVGNVLIPPGRSVIAPFEYQMSSEAAEAKQLVENFPEGYERFLITDINNPAASAVIPRVWNYEDPDDQAEIRQLAEQLHEATSAQQNPLFEGFTDSGLGAGGFGAARGENRVSVNGTQLELRTTQAGEQVASNPQDGLTIVSARPESAESRLQRIQEAQETPAIRAGQSVDSLSAQEMEQLRALGYLESDDSGSARGRDNFGRGGLSARGLGGGGGGFGATPEQAESLRALGYIDNNDSAADGVTERFQLGRRYATSRLSAIPPAAPVTPGTEQYQYYEENDYTRVADQPLSTFSIDVDTASYTNVRRFLDQGQMPPPDAIRIEELINYFDYDYEPPSNGDPFAAHIDVAGSPWNPDYQLVRIGIKGREVPESERPASNLVFLLDVSGSMKPSNKLPLVKHAVSLLTSQLDERDRVAIVTYASGSQRVLEPTPAHRKAEILAAIDRLQAGGSTNGSGGIQLAYRTADEYFLPGGVNRVILCTDGDFNVGITNRSDLIRLIEDKARTGVFLSVFGFGMGNLKDASLEQLADHGNGHYGYIDTADEARRQFVDRTVGTLVPIAKDVKIQVEFNPQHVAAYRLIGYENRALKARDFNDDTKDAGEVGAGHAVTALYEIVPPGVAAARPGVDSLRYHTQGAPEPSPAAVSGEFADELMTVKLRYKEPDGIASKLLAWNVDNTVQEFARTSADFRFAVAVASYGMLLRQSRYVGGVTFVDVMAMAEDGLGMDPSGLRAEFMQLVRKAQELWSGISGQISSRPWDRIRVLAVRMVRGEPIAQIDTGRGARARWYKAGYEFENFVIVRIDAQTGCVDFFFEDDRTLRTICQN